MSEQDKPGLTCGSGIPGMGRPRRRQFVTPHKAVYPTGARRRGRKRHEDWLLFRGCLYIENEVLAKAKRYHVNSRGKVVAVCWYGGVRYVFRILSGQRYIGEVVWTASGTARVHVWALVDEGIDTMSVRSVLSESHLDRVARRTRITRDEQRLIQRMAKFKYGWGKRFFVASTGLYSPDMQMYQGAFFSVGRVWLARFRRFLKRLRAEVEE